MRTGFRGVLLIALLSSTTVTTSACGGVDHAARISEVNGVTVVENEGDGLWAGRPDGLRLVLEQTYGVDREPAEAILGGSIRYAGTDSGDVYVLDGQRSRLVRFRPDGSVAWSAGRRGRGPGEFSRAITGVSLTPDQQAVVVSMYDGRLDYWSIGGEFLRSRSIDPEIGIPGVLIGFAGDRMVFAEGLGRRLGAEVIVAPAEDWNAARSFEIVLLPEVPFGGRVSVGIYGGNIASGSGASYELRFYSLDGELLRRVTRAVPYPVGPGYWSDGSGNGARHDFGSVRAPIALPGGHFVVAVGWEQGITDPEATAAARGTDMGWGDPDNDNWRASIDLFDSEGRFLQSIAADGPIDLQGATAFPADIGILGNSAGLDNPGGAYLYALTPDPFPQIRRYRIELGEF